MLLRIQPDGAARCLYSEEISLETLGSMWIERASHVEPDGSGGWQADMSPVGGPLLSGFARRSEALAAEVAWLERNWLVPG